MADAKKSSHSNPTQTFFKSNETIAIDYLNNELLVFNETDAYILISPRTRYWINRMNINDRRQQPIIWSYVQKWEGISKFDTKYFELIYNENNVLIYKYSLEAPS